MRNLLNAEDTRKHGAYHYEDMLIEKNNHELKIVEVGFSTSDLEGDDVSQFIINYYKFHQEWCWHSDNSRNFQDVPECVFDTLVEIVGDAINGY